MNDPATANGWSFYQMSFDPRDRSRSGIEAVRDPGVSWVFLGFVLVSVGVPIMVNVDPWLRRRKLNQKKGAAS